MKRLFSGVSCTDAFLTQRALRIAVAVSLMLLVLSSCNGSAALTGFVEDRTGLLTEDQRARIDRFNRQLFEELGIHLRTVILKQSPADINATAVELFDRLRIGGTTSVAKGMLLLVDPNGKQVRLEIGYDLEGVFTDAFIGYVERRQMVPELRLYTQETRRFLRQWLVTDAQQDNELKAIIRNGAGEVI
ncbi:MAG: TPM domain-containing protein [Desulfobacterales bacterium]